VKHKIEPFGQWEMMLSHVFGKSVNTELRQAFIDVAEGEYSQAFLHGLSSIMSDRSCDDVLLRNAISSACSMAGETSPITRTLTSFMVRANTEHTNTTDEFGQALIAELANCELQGIGYAQLKAMKKLPSETFSIDVDLSSRFLVTLVKAFQQMIDGVLAQQKKENRHGYLSENVLAILGGDRADVLFVEAIQTIITIIKPVPAIIDTLGQKEQDTLVLLGYEMKCLTKTSRRIKGQILMNELGL
jgi:hypothetical protein